MEININNAFRIAVELSCRPCKAKYHKITEEIEKSCFQLIIFFLQRPLLTTSLFSAFSILLIIILSAAFMVLVGVFVFVFIIILIGGLVSVVLITIISVIFCTATLITIIVVVVMYSGSYNDP